MLYKINVDDDAEQVVISVVMICTKFLVYYTVYFFLKKTTNIYKNTKFFGISVVAVEIK